MLILVQNCSGMSKEMSRVRRRRINNKPSLQFKTETSDTVKQQCIICLDMITSRGRLAVCNHSFCYDCIFEWSKKTNCCPLCKQRFRCITKISNDSPLRQVRVPDLDQSDHCDEDQGVIIESEEELNEYNLEDSFIDDNDISTAISLSTNSSSDWSSDNEVQIKLYNLRGPSNLYQLRSQSQRSTTSSPSYQVSTSPSPSYQVSPSPSQPISSQLLVTSSDDDDDVKKPFRSKSKRILCSSPETNSHFDPLFHSSPLLSWQRHLQDKDPDEQFWLSTRKKRRSLRRKPYSPLYKKRRINDSHSSDSDWNPFEL